jgi:dTDP-4-dehydrorhamnose reductase
MVVGATGMLGQAVADALGARHEVVAVTRKTTPGVDIADPASVRALYRAVGALDAVVSVAGGRRGSRSPNSATRTSHSRSATS